MTLFDADLPYVRRTVNEKPNRYLGASFGGVPIDAQLNSIESVDAAIANMPNRESQRGRVLAFLEEYGGHTDEQIQDALGMDPNTQRPRRVELARAGLIKKVGVARTRSGRSAAVWGVA